MEQQKQANKPRIAVIGSGYFGSLHARKFSQSPHAELVGVCDPNSDSVGRLAKELGVQAYSDHRDLMGKVDGVSVAVPTRFHYSIGRDFLDSGADVLVEKPMCQSLGEAQDLIDLAEKKKSVLQVGHLERFNPAIGVLREHLKQPRFIECERMAPFKKRGTDVNVVLDMMIHDIDLVLHLADSPIKSIEAVGYPLMSDEEDMAKAWIVFESGCLATITASRVSPKIDRVMKVYQAGSYMTLDLGANSFVKTDQRLRGGEELEWSGIEKSFPKTDNLQLEADSFAQSIATRAAPVVSGMDGLRALEASLKINASFSGMTAVL